MKGFVKVIIAGAVILGIGIAVLVIALGLNGWKFSPSEYEMKTYETDSEIQTFKLDFAAGELKVDFYEGDKISIEYPENNAFTTEFNISGGTLTAKADKRHWYNFGWLIGEVPATTVLIPKNYVLNFYLTVNAGSVSLASGNFGEINAEMNAGKLTFGEVNCSVFKAEMNAGAINARGVVCNKFEAEINAGAAEYKNISCNDIYAEVNAGTMKLEVFGAETEYTISVDTAAGSCNKQNHAGSNPDKRIRGDVNAGSLNIEFINE